MTTVSIGTDSDLVAFATRVNAGETTLDAVLTADIDLSSVSSSWVSIGDSTYPYEGTFDGGGHTVSNLTSSTWFIYSSDIAIIKNTIFSSFTITSTINDRGASILYNPQSVSKCMFDNCSISQTGTGDISVGLIYSASSVSDILILGGSLYVERNGGSWNCEGAAPIIGFRGSGDVIENVYCNMVSIVNKQTGGSNVAGTVAGIYSNTWAVDVTETVRDSLGLTPTITNSGKYQTIINNKVGNIRVSGTSSINVTNCYALNGGTDKNSKDGLAVTSSLYTQKGFFDGTGVGGTTYLSWDFVDTWEWDAVNNRPKLKFVSSPKVKLYNGGTWVDGIPYVYTSTGWKQADKVYVYDGTAWKESV